MKKIFKQMLSFAAILAMVVTLVPTTVSAKETGKPEISVSLDKTDIKRGDKVTATIKIDTNAVQQINALSLQLNYDSDVLSTTNDNVKKIVSNPSEIASSNVRDDSVVAITYATYGSTYISSCDLYSVQFTATNDAKSGATPITVTNLNSNGNIIPMVQSTDDSGVATDLKATVVNANANIIVPIESITLKGVSESIEMNKEDTKQLEVQYNPEDTTDDKTITWTSSNTAAVTVDQTGKITATGVGNSIVTATVGSKQVKVDITVKSPLKGIDLGDDIEILKNEEKKLAVSYNPEDTTDDKTVDWASSDTDVLTIDENGQVKGLKEGTSTVTAKVGNFEDAITITVKEIPLTEITIDGGDIEILKEQSKDLTVIYNPENTTDDKTANWSTSDDSIVSVDNNGKITAKKEGTADITATVGNITSKITVTVKESHLDSFTLLQQENDKLYLNGKISIWVKLNPEECTDKLTYSWSSSDDSIATVDESGNVTAKKPGKVTITAKITTEYGKEMESNIDITIPEDGSAATVGSSATTSSPKTGDMPIAGIVTLAVVALAGSVFIVRRKLVKQK